MWVSAWIATELWVSGFVQTIAGRGTDETDSSWLFVINSDGGLVFQWWDDDSNSHNLFGPNMVSDVGVDDFEAVEIGVEWIPDDGDGGHLARFYRKDTAGEWQQIGDDATGSGVADMRSTDADLEVGSIGQGEFSLFSGEIREVEIRDGGRDGTVVAHPVFAEEQPGTASFTDEAGREWTIHGEAEIIWSTRFVGEVASWTPQQTLGGEGNTPHEWVAVKATGLTRQLAQGADPLEDVISRYARINAAVGFWPLTDPKGSTQARSGLPTGEPLRFVALSSSTFVSVHPTFGEGFLAPWLPPVVKAGGDSAWSGGQLRGRTFPVNAPTNYAVDFLFRVEAGQEDDDLPTNLGVSLIADHPSEIRTRWRLLIPSDAGETTIRIQQSNDDGVVDNFDDIAAGALWDGQTHHIRLNINEATTGAATWSVYIDGVLADSDSYSITGVGGSNRPLGLEAAVDWFADGTGSPREVSPIHFGYVTVWAGSTVPSIANTHRAYQGYAGETAGDRIDRLCDEQDIPFVGDLAHDMDDTVPLGPQYPDGLVALLQEAAGTDRGLLLDGGTLLSDAPALNYRPHRDLYNQTPALELDYGDGEIGQPFEPKIDDFQVANDVTATRRDGASVRKVDEDGPLGVDEIGRYTGVVNSNPLGDAMVGDQAGWRLHLGTVDEVRYPQITIDLDAAPHLVEAVALLGEGDRITIDNLPDQISPDLVSLIVLGWTEVIGSHRRTITLNCVPEVAYHIAEVAHGQYGIISSDTATIAEDLDTTEIGITFNIGAGHDWADETSAGWEEFLIMIGGELMRVTALSGATGTYPNRQQSMNVTRSVNGVVKEHTTGERIEFIGKIYIGL
jgi:hypothetical protein